MNVESCPCLIYLTTSFPRGEARKSDTMLQAGSLEKLRAANFLSQRVFSNPRGKENFLKSHFLTPSKYNHAGGEVFS